jgi:hypothetical protein
VAATAEAMAWMRSFWIASAMVLVKKVTQDRGLGLFDFLQRGPTAQKSPHQRRMDWSNHCGTWG